jgi:hypothetical protein
MNEPFVFNTTFPTTEYLHQQTVANDLNLYGYQLGRFISYFSGSYIKYNAGASGSVLDDTGKAIYHSANSKVFSLNLYNNTITGSAFDVIYTIDVNNFIVGWKILSYYSGSTLTNIGGLTLSQFTGLGA